MAHAELRLSSTALRFELPLPLPWPRMRLIPESEIIGRVAELVVRSLVAADGIDAKPRL